MYNAFYTYKTTQDQFKNLINSSENASHLDIRIVANMCFWCNQQWCEREEEYIYSWLSSLFE